MAALERVLGSDEVSLVTWLWLHPPSESAGDAFPLLEWQIFHSLSLRDAAGERRPVYEAWTGFQIPRPIPTAATEGPGR